MSSSKYTQKIFTFATFFSLCLLFTTLSHNSEARPLGWFRETRDPEEVNDVFIEQYLLDKFKNFISKDAGSYEVKTKKGTKIKLENTFVCVQNSNACLYKAKETNWLLDVVNNRYIIFKHFTCEKGGDGCSLDVSYRIIDIESGKEIKVESYPHFSPDYKKISTVYQSGNGDSVNVTNVCFVESGKCETVPPYEMQDPSATDLKIITPAVIFHSWINNNEIEFYVQELIDIIYPKLILSYNSRLKQFEYRVLERTEKEVSNYSKKDEAADVFEKRYPDIRNYFSDKKIVLPMLKSQSTTARYIDKKLLDDKEVALEAAKSNDCNIKYLSERLQADVDVQAVNPEKEETDFFEGIF